MANSKSELPDTYSEFRLNSRKLLRQKLSMMMDFGNGVTIFVIWRRPPSPKPRCSAR